MAKMYKDYNILASGTVLRGVSISVTDSRINIDNLVEILTNGKWDISLKECHELGKLFDLMPEPSLNDTAFSFSNEEDVYFSDCIESEQMTRKIPGSYIKTTY